MANSREGLAKRVEMASTTHNSSYNNLIKNSSEWLKTNCSDQRDLVMMKPGQAKSRLATIWPTLCKIMSHLPSLFWSLNTFLTFTKPTSWAYILGIHHLQKESRYISSAVMYHSNTKIKYAFKNWMQMNVTFEWCLTCLRVGGGRNSISTCRDKHF